MFKHFLITRFNLKVRETNELIPEMWEQDNSWLQERFNLFEKFCLPSVANQSNLNFTWLVYFDADTPQDYKDRIDAWRIKYPFISPIYKPSYNDFVLELASDINDRSIEEYVLMSRLDNDDILEKDAIKVIQGNFRAEHGLLINLAKGYCFSMGEKSFSTSYIALNGPFVSMISLNSGHFETVYDKNHSTFIHDKNIIQVLDQEYWIQLIHGKNLQNRVKGSLKRVVDPVGNFGMAGYHFEYDVTKEITYFIYNALRQLLPISLRRKVGQWIRK